MADVGDRIAVTSKGKPRSGVLIAVSGAMVTVRWDTGGETSLIPGPGVLSVVNSRRRTPSANTRPTTSGATAAGRTPLAKKPVTKKPVTKKPVTKKPVTKGTSSSRTTGKKTR